MVQGGLGAEPSGRSAQKLSWLGRLGRGAARHRWWVIGIWLLAIVAVVVANQRVDGQLRDSFSIPGTDSQRAVDLLDRRFPAQNLPTATVVVATRSGTLDPTVTADITAAVAKLDDVATVAKPEISSSGDIATITVTYAKTIEALDHDTFSELERATEGAVASAPDVRVAYGGAITDLFDTQSSAASYSTGIGLGAALVIMVVSFGAFIAALLPLTIALVGVGAARTLLELLAGVFTIGTIAPLLGAMIGLGVGIDYSLFIVTRYRQIRAGGHDVVSSVGYALATSGSAVLFAGMTVCLALAGLALTGIPYVAVLGFSAALFVGVMVVAALTLLPALIGLSGRRIKPRDVSASTFWRRWAHGVARRPWTCVIVSVIVLGTLAAPVLSMRLGFADDGNDPKSSTMRQAYDLIATGFGPGANGPLLVVMSLPSPTAATVGPELEAAEALVASLKAERGVASVTGPIPNRRLDAAVVLVQPDGAPNAPSTLALVRRLRGETIPEATRSTPLAGEVFVGGETAELIDLTDRVSSRLLWSIGFVISAAFVLLLVVFRSVFVPIKAAVMNLLSIGAAYGVVVAVFQWGWGRSLIGLHQSVPIESFVPLMMFAILFGLSMDYEVFLLSRIREEFLRTGDNRESVAAGLTATARVITSAALIMIAVFLSFLASDQPVVKMMGLGLAVAVLVDATLVRLVLVPATMELAGKANWWFPKTLDRIVPHIGLDASVPEALGADDVSEEGDEHSSESAGPTPTPDREPARR